MLKNHLTVTEINEKWGNGYEIDVHFTIVVTKTNNYLLANDFAIGSNNSTQEIEMYVDKKEIRTYAEIKKEGISWQKTKLTTINDDFIFVTENGLISLLENTPYCNQH